MVHVLCTNVFLCAYATIRSTLNYQTVAENINLAEVQQTVAISQTAGHTATQAKTYFIYEYIYIKHLFAKIGSQMPS